MFGEVEVIRIMQGQVSRRKLRSMADKYTGTKERLYEVLWNLDVALGRAVSIQHRGKKSGEF